MFYDAANGKVKVGDSDMDYVSFGTGAKTLVIIPGLGDGLRTVKGTALAMAMIFKEFTNDYKVYIFSRKNHLEQGYTTRDMAADYKSVMENLGISKADVMGISLGGMIAQHMAIEYPGLINRLVLAVTLSKPNDTLLEVVGSWLILAETDDEESIFIDTTEKSFTEKRLRLYRPLYPLLGKIAKPRDFNRFIIQANAGLRHNTYDDLDKIKCPAFVIGVDNDQIVGAGSSEEIAGRIENSRLFIYEGYGHGVYEEAKDFNSRVLEFLTSPV